MLEEREKTSSNLCWTCTSRWGNLCRIRTWSHVDRARLHQGLCIYVHAINAHLTAWISFPPQVSGDGGGCDFKIQKQIIQVKTIQAGKGENPTVKRNLKLEVRFYRTIQEGMNPTSSTSLLILNPNVQTQWDQVTTITIITSKLIIK